MSLLDRFCQDLRCTFGHWYRGCACRFCGDERHTWNHCKCERCGAGRFSDHDWDGCLCAVCGRKRNASDIEAHVWEQCRCTRCGQPAPPYGSDVHQWSSADSRCVVCRTGCKHFVQKVDIGVEFIQDLCRSCQGLICLHCQGQGLLPCPQCNPHLYGSHAACTACHGLGRSGTSCKYCGGRGVRMEAEGWYIYRHTNLRGQSHYSLGGPPLGSPPEAGPFKTHLGAIEHLKRIAADARSAAASGPPHGSTSDRV